MRPMRREPCPNMNHRNTNPPVRYCPNCGEVVNERIAIKRCSKESHATKRKQTNKYCVNCGEQLIN